MARFSEAEKTLIWDRRSQGVGMRTVARELGRAHGSVRWMVESYGGVGLDPRFVRSGICRWGSGRRSPGAWLPVSRCGRSLVGWAARLRR